MSRNHRSRIESKSAIKYMFMRKRTHKSDTVDIAILTDKNQYIECTVVFKQKFLTPFVCWRIRGLFSGFIIDKSSVVVVNELMDETHLLYQYLMLLHQHVDFNLSTVTSEAMCKRICYYYMHNHKKLGKKFGKKSKMKAAWELAVERNTCSWITKEIDYAIQNKSDSIGNRMKALRLAILYLAMKNYFS